MKIIKIFIMFLLLLGNVSDEIDTDINNKSNRVEDLTQADFSVSDGVDTIALDTRWSELIMHRELIVDEPTNPMNHFVGEIYDGIYFYKVFGYIYDGIMIYVSDLNYEKKGRNQYTLYISQIVITDPSFCTPREIKIGSSKREVIDSYGNGKISLEKDVRLYSYDEQNDYILYSYYYEDMVITFYFDDLNCVKQISFHFK